MKKNKLSSRPAAEQAIHQVLQAERDAEQAIRDCEDEARESPESEPRLRESGRARRSL